VRSVASHVIEGVVIEGVVIGGVADDDEPAGCARFVLPAPGRHLALLAEFHLSSSDERLTDRIEALMASFRWAASSPQ
jgi:hypothetical protein